MEMKPDDLNDLYSKLLSLLSDSSLTLADSEETTHAFEWLLFALNASELTVNNASLELLDNKRIEIKGNVSFVLPKGKYDLTMWITTSSKSERNFTVEFTADAAVEGKASEVFGTIYPTFHPENGVAAYEDILGDITISDVLEINYSDDDYAELPLHFSCMATLPNKGRWSSNPFCAILQAAGSNGKVTGRMSPNAVFDNVKFNAVLELDKTFTELIPSLRGKISAFIGLQNGMDGNDDPVGDFAIYQPYVSRAFAGLRFKLDGLSDEIRITAPLFRGGEYLTLGADFGKGLSPADMVNFITKLFGNVPGDHLMIPEATSQAII